MITVISFWVLREEDFLPESRPFICDMNETVHVAPGFCNLLRDFHMCTIPSGKRIHGHTVVREFFDLERALRSYWNNGFDYFDSLGRQLSPVEFSGNAHHLPHDKGEN